MRSLDGVGAGLLIAMIAGLALGLGAAVQGEAKNALLGVGACSAVIGAGVAAAIIIFEIKAGRRQQGGW